MSKKLRVGVLFGGRSAEHEVSLLSAKNVIQALDRDKYEPILIGIDKQGGWHFQKDAQYLLNSDDPKKIELAPNTGPVAITPARISAPMEQSMDVIFPVLHGTYGEDGTIQGLLKLLDIPYVGPNLLGSGIGMDKDVAKRLLRDAGLPIAKFLTVFRESKIQPTYASIVKELGEIIFVKPANAGSSVGVSKVRNEEEFHMALKEAFRFDRKIVIEEFIKGREIECAILGNFEPIASIPGEIRSTHDFYSYEAKYIDENGAVAEIPAKISDDAIVEVQRLSIATFKALQCEGMARVDIFLTETEQMFINEINTIPGFTKISMYPKLWNASGIGYTELLDRLISLALERHEEEKQNETAV